MGNAVNLNRAIWLLTAVSALVWLFFAAVENTDLSKPMDFLGLLPWVVTVDTAVVSVFAKWGWRWGLWQNWLVELPNLNGTWIGEIRSDYEDGGERIAPVPAMLTIRQTLFATSCVMQTEEMRSDSYAEGFRIDDERQLRQIAYAYASTPRPPVLDRSAPHNGSALLDIVVSPEKRLRGRYWTERGTGGEMDLAFHGPQRLEVLPVEMAAHPMVSSAANR